MLQDKLHLFVARFTVPLDWQTSGRRCAHFHSLLSISAPCYPYLELIKAKRKGNKSKQGFEFTPGNRSRSRSLPHKRQRTNRQCQDRLKSWIQVHGFHITVKRVSVSNDDSDAKENDKKALQSWKKVLGHFCVSGAFSNSHRSNLSPHPTNNVGRVYPEFFPSFRFV